MKVYGSDICIECRNYKKIQAARGFDAEFISITENTANMKEFLRMRDSDSVFDEIRAHGGIGIPLFVQEDGTKTFDVDEALGWMGQGPVTATEFLELYEK